MGIQAAAGRIGAIAGTILFGQLTEVDLSLPILVVSTIASLLGHWLHVFLLPWSKQWLQIESLLGPPKGKGGVSLPFPWVGSDLRDYTFVDGSYGFIASFY